MNNATDKTKLVRVQKKWKSVRLELIRLRMENAALKRKLSRWGRPTKEEQAARATQANPEPSLGLPLS